MKFGKYESFSWFCHYNKDLIAGALIVLSISAAIGTFGYALNIGAQNQKEHLCHQKWEKSGLPSRYVRNAIEGECLITIPNGTEVPESAIKITDLKGLS